MPPRRPLTVDDNRHGTNAGYNAGCPCKPCGVAHAAYGRSQAYDAVLGRVRTVPADNARTHITRCLRWGVRYVTFGCGASRIHRTNVPWIHARTETRILAVQPQPGVNCWPTFSARRRLQALIALGHPQTVLIEYTGLGATHVSMIINDYRHHQHLKPGVWVAIDRVYESLSMVPGMSVRSKNRATAAGWLPPLAFDNIDDPDERPTMGPRSRRHRTDVDDAAVLRMLAGERMSCTKAERVEVTRRWVASGRAVNELERVQGWNVSRYGHVTDQSEQVAS